MDEAELESILKEKAVDGRIPCAVSLAVARDAGVPPNRVGDALNRLDIRIEKCQLGCFE